MRVDAQKVSKVFVICVVTCKRKHQRAMSNWLCGDTAEAFRLLPENVVVAHLVQVVGGQAGGDGREENHKEDDKSEDIFCFSRSANTDLLGESRIFRAIAWWISVARWLSTNL